MYARETASGIANLLKLVERVSAELGKSYQIEDSFNRRWWDNGEYGVYIRKGDHNLLWFGIWQAYWELLVEMRGLEPLTSCMRSYFSAGNSLKTCMVDKVTVSPSP